VQKLPIVEVKKKTLTETLRFVESTLIKGEVPSRWLKKRALQEGHTRNNYYRALDRLPVSITKKDHSGRLRYMVSINREVIAEQRSLRVEYFNRANALILEWEEEAREVPAARATLKTWIRWMKIHGLKAVNKIEPPPKLSRKGQKVLATFDDDEETGLLKKSMADID
jgi:tRNA threonylcarbamoyladenosine modification (KEOPS) complex  Pcc1 subunit